MYKNSPAVDVAASEASLRILNAIKNKSPLFASIYGASSLLDTLLGSWLDQGVPLHNITIVPAAQILGADGAYEIKSDVIMLADSFVKSASFERLIDVITEEIGHRLDATLGQETAGDEGQAFATALRGEPVLNPPADSSEPLGLEYAVTVNDSGGYEGSFQTLKLETKAGSTIKYRYEHYSIPDQFIIRYEGRNIFDTGFVGSSRSGSINLPAGTSDSLEIIVATDDAGTAWNYTVTAEPVECEDVQPWKFTADTDFKHNEDTKKCETTGNVYIGRSDGTAQLLRALATSSAAYDKTSLDLKGAQIYSGIGNIPAKLFTADVNLNLNTGIAALSNIDQGQFKLAGLPVEFKSMSLLRDRLAFDVRFKMPDEATGLLVETSDYFKQGLQITAGGAYPVLGFRIDPPGTQEFKLGGIVDVKASKSSIEYRPQEDALRLQSKIEFSNANFAKTNKGIRSLEADLSGPNYIQVNSDGDVDIIGTLKASGTIPLVMGWSLQELELSLNTTTNELGGAATLGTPFGVKFGEGATARAEVEFYTKPFELDKVGLILDNLNKPIPAYPAFFFQRIGGSVNNFAPSNTQDVEGKFTIGATLGPKIAGTSLALAQYDATVTSKYFEGQMTTDLLTAQFKLNTPLFTKDLGTFTLIKDESKAKLDWSEGKLTFSGTSNILDGFVVSTGSFTATKNFDFSFARGAQLSLPNFVPVYGGTKLSNGNIAVNYTNNGNDADDYVAGWGQYNVVTPLKQFNLTLGLRIQFDGTVDRIGSGNIPTTSSWFISGNQEYAMLTASWENPAQGVKVRVKKPDGTWINEEDFLANNIAIVSEFSSDSSRTVIIDAPVEGTWDMEILDTTDLGKIAYEASGPIKMPKFSFNSAPIINTDGTVSYGFEAITSTANTYVNFYYDDDLTNLDGLFAGSVTLPPSTSSSSFTWDAAQVVPGQYYIYAMVDDGSGPIVTVLNNQAVAVGSEADLSVSISADKADVNPGDNVQLTVAISNLSKTTLAKAAKAYINLPKSVSLAPPYQSLVASDFAQYELDLGNIAANSNEVKTINLVVNNDAIFGDQLAADVYIVADTYDSVTENDGDAVQIMVRNRPAQTPVDLIVSSSVSNLSGQTVKDKLSYKVTIKNDSTTAATGVVLTETVQGLTSMSANLAHTFNGRDLIIPIGRLDAGQSLEVDITALAPVAGTAFVTSSVIADQFDRVIIDNEKINIADILAGQPDSADLSLSINSVSANQISVTVTNDGPGIASDVQIKLNLPANTVVIDSSAIQGSFDLQTGLWTVGNLRDNLSRSITFTLNDLSGGKITAEIVNVNEPDTDSVPNDGQGDDFASIFDDLPISLSLADTLKFPNIYFAKADVSIQSGPPHSLIIDTDGNGSVDQTVLLANLPGDDFYVWQIASGTRLAFQNYLPEVAEKKALDLKQVNGITNTDILTGDGTLEFSLTIDTRSEAAFSNALGIYEVDSNGDIKDVRILINNTKQSTGPVAITGVENGHQLGFFIISDGKNLADSITNFDALSFVDKDNQLGKANGGKELFLAVNGVVQKQNVFHSYASTLNADSLQHSISGLSANGKSLIIGFEDQFGGGDQDFQDTLFSVNTIKAI